MSFPFSKSEQDLIKKEYTSVCLSDRDTFDSSGYVVFHSSHNEMFGETDNRTDMPVSVSTQLIPDVLSYFIDHPEEFAKFESWLNMNQCRKFSSYIEREEVSDIDEDD